MNQSETAQWLREAGAFYVSTMDGAYPRVRPHSFVMEYGGRLCFCTGSLKPTYAQLTRNPHVEICAMGKGFSWLRLHGEAVFLADEGAKQAAYRVMPMLRDIFAEDKNTLEIFCLKGAEADQYSFNDKHEMVKETWKLEESVMKKKILILNGSPTEGGNTEALGRALLRGAQDAGHEGQMLRLSDLRVAPYTGPAQTAEGDDMKQILNAMAAADVIVLASPLYWMQFTAQLKTVMDRLSFDTKDLLAGKETALLVCAASPEEVVRQNIVPYYQLCFVQSLGWKDRGMVLTGGVIMPGDVEKTDYVRQACELGRSL